MTELHLFPHTIDFGFEGFSQNSQRLHIIFKKFSDKTFAEKRWELEVKFQKKGGWHLMDKGKFAQSYQALDAFIRCKCKAKIVSFTFD